MNSESTIDLIMSNVCNVNYSGCINFMVSDHCPVYIVKKRLSNKEGRVSVFTRSLRHYDVDEYSYRLQVADLGQLREMDDINDMWDLIVFSIAQIVDDLCPFSWKTIRSDRPIWFNSHIRELGLARDRLLRNYRRGNRKNHDLFREGVIKRRAFNKACKVARQDFYREQLLLHRSDQKQFWKMEGDLISPGVNRKIEWVFKYGTDMILDEQGSVNEINLVFATVGEIIARELCSIPHLQLDPREEHDMCFFKEMTISNFLDIVGELKISKSIGISSINSRIIIDTFKAVPHVFVFICNYSLCEGVFPDEFKIARISVIPKKGDLRCIDNLRPISLLNILGKVIEKFVKRSWWITWSKIIFFLKINSVSGVRDLPTIQFSC